VSISLQAGLHCIVKGDAASAINDCKMAIELYSAAIAPDSPCHTPFAHRNKAKYVEALYDAEKVISNVILLTVVLFS